jgi:hypothetical protein
MRTLILTLAILGIVLCGFAVKTYGKKSHAKSGAKQPAYPEVDDDLLLEAIRRVEHTARHQVGRAGERSEYQFIPAVWRQHSKFPIWRASSNKPECVAEQQRVARAHLSWIRVAMPRIGLSTTPYTLALVWNAGIGRVSRHETSLAQQDYANRVNNTYQNLVSSSTHENAQQ